MDDLDEVAVGPEPTEYSYCQRCDLTLPIVNFMRPRKAGKQLGLRQFKRCNACSGFLPEASFEVDDSLEAFELIDCEFEDLLDTLTELFEDADFSRNSVLARIRVCLSDNFLQEIGLTLTVVLSAECDDSQLNELYSRFIKKFVKVDVEYGSGYYWGVQYVRVSNNAARRYVCTASLWCASRDDRSGSRAPMDTSTSFIRQPGKRKAIERFPCRGSVKVNIDVQKKTLVLIVHHLCEHERPQFRDYCIPTEAIQYLEKTVHSVFRKPELYRALCMEKLIDSAVVTRSQVNYHISRILSRSYVKNVTDQLQSAQELLGSEKYSSCGFKPILYENDDEKSVLAFVTPFFQYARFVTEVIIDSTFKTNAVRFELFALNANVGGFGLPLTYMFYSRKLPEKGKVSQSEGEGVRCAVLMRWFSAVLAWGLKPLFFLSDKDLGQIRAIQTVFHRACVQLCLKHAVAAIDTRIRVLNRGVTSYDALSCHALFSFVDESWTIENDEVPARIAPYDSRGEIMQWFSRHFNLHALIPVALGKYLSAEEHYANSVQEAYNWCHERNLLHFWIYLWNEWYSPSKWVLFSRSTKPCLCLSRTTNIIESHWRKLKYDYKYSCNRPRLDKLCEILAGTLVVDLEIQVRQMENGRFFPSWWQEFSLTWKKLSEFRVSADAHTRYEIDVHKWVCSCGSFLNSTYFLCKHLVSAYRAETTAFPTFWQVTRRHDYPLLSFDGDSSPLFRSVMAPNMNSWGPDTSTNPDEGAEFVTGLDFGDCSDFEAEGGDTVQALRALVKSSLEESEELLVREQDNIHFIRAFGKALKQFSNRVAECKQALRSRRQQGTWTTGGPADVLR